MSAFASSRACLRVMGDELLPHKISELLGCEPSLAPYKGELLVGKVSQVTREAKFGVWRFSASEQAPENLGVQI